MPGVLKDKFLTSLERFSATNQELSSCSCFSGLPSVDFAVGCTLAGTLLLRARPYANTISLIKGLTPRAPPEALPPLLAFPLYPQAAGVIFPKAQLDRKGPALPACPHVPFLPPPLSVPHASVRKQDPRRKQAPVPKVPDRPPLPCPSAWDPWGLMGKKGLKGTGHLFLVVFIWPATFGPPCQQKRSSRL